MKKEPLVWAIGSLLKEQQRSTEAAWRCGLFAIVVFSLLGCGTDQAVKTEQKPVVEVKKQPVEWEFVSLEPNRDYESLRSPQTVSTVKWKGQSYAIGYDLLARMGDEIAGLRLGTLNDVGGVPISGEDGFCNTLDYSGLIQAHGEIFIFSHMECIPGGLQLSRLNQDVTTGDLSIEWSKLLDSSQVDGTWLPCSGDVTGWGSVLSSEEYEPDARHLMPDGEVKDRIGGYAGMKSWANGKAELHPYDYGWMPEVVIKDAEGTVEITKHYAMGRFSHEIGRVMPDNKTVFMSDDGRGGGFFMFVADQPTGLDSGTLYAAEWRVDDSESAPVRWISLGHADNKEIKALVDAHVRFEQIFRYEEPQDGACSQGMTLVRSMTGDECLSLQDPSPQVPKPALAASRLETRRYAGLIGATTEFLKSEGIAFDPTNKNLYLALSAVIGKSLAEPELSPELDHVRLKENKCGVIIGGDTNGGQRDTTSNEIESDFVLLNFEVILRGQPSEEDPLNPCAVDGMANPDNVTFMQGQGKLMIAEDSPYHILNGLWLYDIATEQLTLLQVGPPSSEISGIGWYPDVNGFGYLVSAIQNPLRFRKSDKITFEVTEAEKKSYLGVIGPFPESSGVSRGTE